MFDAKNTLCSNLPLEGRVPLRQFEITVSDRIWRVFAAPNQDELLSIAEDFELFPFGLLLWESAVGLAKNLAANPALVAGKRVLEIGAGVGFAGMIARQLGAFVRQTDYQADSLKLAKFNARINEVNGIETFLADWRVWTHTPKYDVILGADVTYERGMHFHLENIFVQNLAPGGCILLSDPGRPQSLDFAAHLEKSGWKVSLESISVLRLEPEEGSEFVEIDLIRITREGRRLAMGVWGELHT